MIVKIDKSFEKNTNKIKDKYILNKIADSIEVVQKYDKISKISGLKKLKGFEKTFINIFPNKLTMQILYDSPKLPWY